MYGSQGRLNRAFEVVEALGRQPVSTDARVATSLLKECVRNGDVDRAADIFRLLLPTGGPDAKSFWPLISCCVRRGEFLRAHGFVKAWHAVNRTKGALNDALTEQLLCTLESRRENQESEALALLEQMRPSEGDACCKAA